MHYDDALHDIARRQHGLLSRSQALGVGMSPNGWRSRLDRGRWEEVHPGVARLPAAPGTIHQRALAAVLATGGGAVVSHVTAAQLWCGDRAPRGLSGIGEVHLIIERNARNHHLPGVVVHRPRDGADLGPRDHHGIPVTTVTRTAMDLGAVVPPALLAETVETFVVLKLVKVGTLRHALTRHAKPGRAGAGALRSYLDERALAELPADSVVEAALADLLAEFKLPPAVHHHVVEQGRLRVELDYAYPELGIDIEIDGFEWHGHRGAFERDRARDVQLAALGWTVLRFTWLQMTQRRAWVADQIGAVVATRRRAA
jgi:very-short-patch-repair endonuclease